VSHHNMIGNRYKDPAPLNAELTAFNGVHGFTAKYAFEATNKSVSHAINHFEPGHLLNRIQFSDGTEMLISSYATPIEAGKSLFIGNQILIQPTSSTAVPKNAAHFHMKRFPVWLQHLLFSFVLHQDNVLLQQQEQHLAKAKIDSSNFALETYSPNGQDRMVLWFKMWLAKSGMDKQLATLPCGKQAEVFDVYHSHTKACTVCSAALSKMQRAVQVLQYTSWLVMVVALAKELYALLFLSALLQVMSYALVRFSQLFHEYQYSHSDNK
jgi:hypothetical protein